MCINIMKQRKFLTRLINRHSKHSTKVQGTYTPMSNTEANKTARQSTWWHRAWLTMGCTTVLITLAKPLTNTDTNTNNPFMWVQFILAGSAGYLLADLTTGLFHWAIDNYGSASTPFFGNQIQLFQIHHSRPLDLTTGGFARRNHAVGQAVTLVWLPMALKSNNPVYLVFLGALGTFILFCQQTHSWAHCAKDELPRLVVALQDSGLLLSKFHHTGHHKRPHNNSYCVVSGIWNRVLDKYEVFTLLEKSIFSLFGVQPRSWSSQPIFERFE